MIVPAFGYENKLFNANDHRISIYKKTSSFSYTSPNDYKLHMRIENAIKALAYLPVLGTFLGLVRMGRAIFSDIYEGNRVKHFVRGLIEFLSIGLVVLLITDLVVQCRIHQTLKYERI